MINKISEKLIVKWFYKDGGFATSEPFDDSTDAYDLYYEKIKYASLPSSEIVNVQILRQYVYEDIYREMKTN
jgi:hypothetical protein